MAGSKIFDTPYETSGVFIDLLSSSRFDQLSVVNCQVRDFEGPEHVARGHAGTHICAVVCRRPPFLPLRENARNDQLPEEKHI